MITKRRSTHRRAEMVWSFLAGSALAASACAVLWYASRRGAIVARNEEAIEEQKRKEEKRKASFSNTKRQSNDDSVSKSSSSPLQQKTVVVTGASSGIGRAIAKAFHARGANVAVGARRIERLRELCDALNDASSSPTSRAIAVKTDVTSASDVKNLVEKAEAAFGRPVDVLVNVAGVMYFTLMKNCKEDEWERTVDVNCKGVLNGFAAVLKSMCDRGQGHIITISSDAGRRVFKSLAVYSASKHFVEALSEATRRELVGTGLRVTTIQPGDCATDLVRENTDKEALDELGIKAGAVVGEGWGNKWNVLEPEDVARAVLYAAEAPAHVAVNEVLIEPRDQE